MTKALQSTPIQNPGGLAQASRTKEKEEQDGNPRVKYWIHRYMLTKQFVNCLGECLFLASSPVNIHPNLSDGILPPTTKEEDFSLLNHQAPLLGAAVMKNHRKSPNSHNFTLPTFFTLFTLLFCAISIPSFV